jgi:hypothetical protein
MAEIDSKAATAADTPNGRRGSDLDRSVFGWTNWSGTVEG